MLRHAVPTTVLIVALTSALAGCGGEEEGSLSQARDYAKESGNQIAEDARTAMHAIDTVHVEGDVLDSEGTKITVDLDVSADDTCAGKVGIGDGEISLRSIDGVAWYQGDKEFWRSVAPAKGAGDRIAKRVGEKWVKLEGELASLRAFCSIDSLTAQMVPPEAEAEAVGPTMSADGPAVRLDVTHGETESRTFVLAAEPHRIVKWTQDGSGELVFSDFDKEFEVVEPAADEVFDLAELEK
ncbi:hypothetical protein WBG06_04315 [Nocardioides sp. CCNWLW239]|uniref:hypothetical protein n=1 Tax=Nocardioides sp. CCNWLW239 TaxID=3128902 RepID=UPI0030178A81